VGHYVDSESEYDGNDPATFRRANTLDATDNRIYALRGWGAIRSGGWSLLLDGSYLDSANRNLLRETPLNSTFGERFTAGAQLSKTIGGHRLTAVVEHEGEGFRARDQLFFGGTDQDRSRALTGFVGQWRAEWSERFITDLAVRHDEFSAFADATTVRGTALFRPADAWTLHASFGEGIAQPTFYDLYGFFPGSFQGNPNLRPESSTGWEAGIRWRGGDMGIGVTGFASRLQDEILTVFDPRTFIASTVNAEARSPRAAWRRMVNIAGAALPFTPITPFSTRRNGGRRAMRLFGKFGGRGTAPTSPPPVGWAASIWGRPSPMSANGRIWISTPSRPERCRSAIMCLAL
jgi:vitamin B12 transporter